MEKLYWKTIQENNYAIPADQTPTSLTAELFSYLGSTDPESRDKIAYETFANFLEREYYSLEEIEIYIANLEIGIGETESEGVFLPADLLLVLAGSSHTNSGEHLFVLIQKRIDLK